VSEENATGETYTGNATKRVENYDILSGKAEYIHDISSPDCLHMALVRSPHAHAEIEEIDVSDAAAHPDCELILTAADIDEHFDKTPGRLGFTEWALAKNRIRFSGEPVALVVAKDRYVAEDIGDLISIKYNKLDPVTDVDTAAEDDVLLYDDAGTNRADDDEFVFGEFDEAFAEADHVIESEYSWGRISGVPLETAGVVADYDPTDDSFTIDCNLQLYTFNNELIYESLGYPEEKVKMQVPEHIGGSFGTKIAAGARYCALAAMASHQLEQPVTFTEDRIEYLQGGDAHSCEREYGMKLAVNDDGSIQGLDISFRDDLGAVPRYPLPQAMKPMAVLTTSYDIENVRYAYELFLTNKVPQTAYRGFGVQQHTFALEMLLEKAARTLGLDPTEFRWQNLITADQMPHKLPSKNIYDSGDYPSALNRITEIVDENERCEGGLLDPDIVEAKRAEGKYRGTQPAVTLEPSAGVIDYATRFEMDDDEIAGFSRKDVSEFPEHLRAFLEDDGTVTISIATSSAGQGHQTVIGQMMADELEVDLGVIESTYLDSVDAPKDFGAAASRMGVMLSGATAGLGEQFRDSLEELAATIWGCDVETVTYANGGVERIDTDDRLALSDLALEVEEQADVTGDELADLRSVSFDFTNPALRNDDFDEALSSKFPTYPATAYSADAPIIEVDINTGEVDILKYYSLHDCGTVLNPDVVNGQVEGAIAHGVGGALLEEFAYDDDGQPLAISLFDYLLPSIKNIPEMELEHRETPSPFTPRGVKGAGEGGVISASAVIPISISSALEPLDVTVNSVPVTPDKIRTAIRNADNDES
jgi:carbon-monoxide dehydrogenase large subunit